MIETPHLTIVDRRPEDALIEEYYLLLHPEIRELDPIVGDSRNPVFYSIYIKGENKHIGICSLYNLASSEIELGVRIFIPEYWNKGYGSEVVNALCGYIFNSYPTVTAVFVKTPVYNMRAIRCYEKCGFAQYSRAVLNGYEMVFMVRQKETNS